MNRYSLLIFALLSLFAFRDGYCQEELPIPRDVVVLLDDSGSMLANDAELLRAKVLPKLLDTLPDSSRISLILFARGARLVIPLTSVSEEGIRERIQDILDQVFGKSLSKREEEAIGKSPQPPLQGGENNLSKKAGNLDLPIQNPIATVTIKEGDTLWNLAAKYYGDPFKWPLILECNSIPETGKSLAVGTVIHIPAIDAEDGEEEEERGDEGARKGMSPFASQTPTPPSKKSTTKDTIKRSGKEEPTNIPVAIERAIYELKHNGRENSEKLILLITDGIIDIEDSPLHVERYRWLKDELASESIEEEIRIFSIALTEQADFELMQSLAQKTNGGYYRVFREADIQTALGSMAEALSSPRPAPQPQVRSQKVVDAKKGSRLPGATKVLVAALAGVVVIGIAVFSFAKRGKKGKLDKTPEIPAAYLMDLEGATDRSNYAINRRITKVGRSNGDDVDICIGESTVSAVHAQIEYRNGNFYLTDLGSTNGTYLDDGEERITDEVCLKAGHIIAFDQYRFKFGIRGQEDKVSANQLSSSKETGKGSRSSPGHATPTPSRKSAFASSSDDRASSPRPANVISARDTGRARVDRKLEDLEAYLIDEGGITDKKIHKFNKNVIRIGRMKDDDTDIWIDEKTVSANHAEIEYKNGNFYLTDLGSRNGTYLTEGKERITSEVRLNGDDIIYFDQYRFRFVVRDQVEQADVALCSANPDSPTQNKEEAQLTPSPGRTVAG